MTFCSIDNFPPSHPMEGLSKVLYNKELTLSAIDQAENPLEILQDILKARADANKPGSCFPSMPPIAELDSLPESVRPLIRQSADIKSSSICLKMSN